MKSVVLLAAVVLAGAAIAQDQGGPPPPGGQGGPPGGFGQGGPGRMRRGPMVGPMLLHMKEVQKELNLSDDQISQINSLLPPPRQGSFGQDQTPPKRLTQEEMDAKLKGILHDDQMNRFRQLELQAEGPRAFSSKYVQVKLGLTTDQETKIRGIEDADRQAPPPAPGDGSDLAKTFREHREKLMSDIEAVLTDDQRSTWNSMVGAKFDFPTPRRHPGGFGAPGGPPPSDGGGTPPPPPPAA